MAPLARSWLCAHVCVCVCVCARRAMVLNHLYLSRISHLQLTGWKKDLGVLCDKRVSVRMKGMVLKTVVRPAGVTELKMLAFSSGSDKDG